MSTFSRLAALFVLRVVRGVPGSPRVLDTQADTWITVLASRQLARGAVNQASPSLPGTVSTGDPRTGFEIPDIS